MEISVFGRKISLDVLILIGIVYIIFAMNTFFSCVNVHKVKEGVQNMMRADTSGNVLANIGALEQEVINLDKQQQKQGGKQERQILSQERQIASLTPKPNEVPIKLDGQPSKATPTSAATSSSSPAPTSAATSSSSPASVKEGFAPASTNNGQSASYSLANYTPTNISSWFPPNLQVQPGKSYSKGVQDILNRPKQPVPLPEGELLMFDNTPFRPECCPSAYSTSTGCACITTGQYNYLIERGGNNVPYSEY